jgi:hypothetical protein
VKQFYWDREIVTTPGGNFVVFAIYDRHRSHVTRIAQAYEIEDADRIVDALNTVAPTEEPFVLEPKQTWTEKALIAVREAGEEGLTADELAKRIGYDPKSSHSLLSGLRIRGDLKLGIPRVRESGRAVHVYIANV